MSSMSRSGLPQRSGETGMFGADLDLAARPGVPMEAEPPRRDPGAHWEEPDRQIRDRSHLKRKGLEEVTPVFGTAQPPRGASGIMRRVAYRIPEHKARHWALLLAADRVDVMEGRLGRLMARPLEKTPLARLGYTVGTNPLRVIGVALLGLIVVRRLLK